MSVMTTSVPPIVGKPPSLELFFDTLNAYQRTEALKAALELDVFTAIGEGKRTPVELAERCAASERGLRILCDYLVTIGFLIKSSGHYDLTADSAMFLDKRAPTYVGGAVSFMASPELVDSFRNLAAAVRKGGTPEGEGTIAAEHPVWVEFARAMSPLQGLPSQLLADLATPLPANARILDIAAGHGLFGIALLRRHSDARVTALDWPNVVEVAKENARHAGVGSRLRALAGNAFEVDFGGPYDLVLITNFLHHFSPAQCGALLRKVHAALAPGGRVMVLEFVPDEDRVHPVFPARFSLMMLGSTPEGDAYTFPEFQKMFASAGFSEITLHALPPTFFRVVSARK
ncbi:MAG: methyltransferase [Candidatus Korobacteraceae bacterium]